MTSLALTAMQVPRALLLSYLRRRMRKMPKKTAEEKEVLRKVRELCEYGERTGDWEPMRRLKALLEEAERAIAAVKHAMEVPKTPIAKKPSRTKGRA
jgi:hypothetical protein